jgi:hypothetical protein
VAENERGEGETGGIESELIRGYNLRACRSVWLMDLNSEFIDIFELELNQL